VKILSDLKAGTVTEAIYKRAQGQAWRKQVVVREWPEQNFAVVMELTPGEVKFFPALPEKTDKGLGHPILSFSVLELLKLAQAHSPGLLPPHERPKS
jgi:hypothetical protein